MKLYLIVCVCVCVCSFFFFRFCLKFVASLTCWLRLDCHNSLCVGLFSFSSHEQPKETSTQIHVLCIRTLKLLLKKRKRVFQNNARVPFVVIFLSFLFFFNLEVSTTSTNLIIIFASFFFPISNESNNLKLHLNAYISKFLYSALNPRLS